MKKLTLVLCFILLFSLISCDNLLGGGEQNEHTHTFVEGWCECGSKDPNFVPAHKHSFVNGKCDCGETVQGYIPPHEHSFVDGRCECGEVEPGYVPPHDHSFVDGRCECGEADPNYVPPHEHSFVDGRCDCGEEDPDYVPPHEHSFVDGRCECGEEDPDYVPIPESVISILALRGLNEQIYISLVYSEEFDYRVYYKTNDDSDYFLLDENLMILNGDKLDCYILGIKAGVYEVKIEAENDCGTATHIRYGIEVAEQDRSGYAHFGSTVGVGAYNNDGTLKENTKIIYVTNENKNTVTLTINGTEYVGLVNILQAQHKSDTPLLVRVIGKITTNQWNYKNVEPRLADGSNANASFFENTFSNEYGENLANLIVKMKFNGGGGKTYNYKTTADGLTDVRLTNTGSGTTTYKGDSFPMLKGKTVFDDDSYYNMLEVKASYNITIEGVGEGAEFFQFGISFEESGSIEIKNITFTGYPEDALNFLGGNRSDLANYGRYWIHNCTFNRGYNAWDISGERDKYAGDGSIDFNNVSGLTLAYNVFNDTKKTMLFGSGDSSACMNMTMHHNYFNDVDSRLPLGRNSNIHSYNNYFYKCTNVSDLRVGSYMFSENNYFENVSKPFGISSSTVKSFGDIFINSNNSGITIVGDRTQLVSGNCKPDNKTNYSGFDINPDLFYYDAELGITMVDYMLSAEEVKGFVLKYAGAGNMNHLPID